MAETPQLYLGLKPGSSETQTGLRDVINYISEVATSQHRIGCEFERLIKRYFLVDPLCKERITVAYRWKEWRG